jgi:hypothetical protein
MPRKISEHQLTVRVPNWLMAAINDVAANKETTASNFVRTTLAQAVSTDLQGYRPKKGTSHENQPGTPLG